MSRWPMRLGSWACQPRRSPIFDRVCSAWASSCGTDESSAATSRGTVSSAGRRVSAQVSMSRTKKSGSTAHHEGVEIAAIGSDSDVQASLEALLRVGRRERGDESLLWFGHVLHLLSPQ